MDSNLFDVLLKEYRDRMAMLTEAMARGSCASFEEYKYTSGQLRGLEAACSIITDLKKRLENADDE
jgi:hypothetical protein